MGQGLAVSRVVALGYFVENQISPAYRWEYQNFGNFTDIRIYHNFFIAIKPFDKLEKHAFFMTYFHCWYIAAIFLLGYCMNTKLLDMQKPNSYHFMGLSVLGIRSWNRLNQIWSIRWGVWRGWMRIVWSPVCFKTMEMGSSVSLAQP